MYGLMASAEVQSVREICPTKYGNFYKQIQQGSVLNCP